MPTQTAGDCKFPRGLFHPIIAPNRCEAKGPRIPACPYDVLAIRIAPQALKSEMSLLGRLKRAIHGGEQACREKAIKLQKTP